MYIHVCMCIKLIDCKAPGYNSLIENFFLRENVDLQLVVAVVLVVEPWRRCHGGLFTFLLEDSPLIGLRHLHGFAPSCRHQASLSVEMFVRGTSDVLEDAEFVCALGCCCGRPGRVESIRLTFMECLSISACCSTCI